MPIPHPCQDCLGCLFPRPLVAAWVILASDCQGEGQVHTMEIFGCFCSLRHPSFLTSAGHSLQNTAGLLGNQAGFYVVRKLSFASCVSCVKSYRSMGFCLL